MISINKVLLITSSLSLLNSALASIEIEKGPNINSPRVQSTNVVRVKSNSQSDITTAINSLKEIGGGTLYFPGSNAGIEYIIPLAQDTNRTLLSFENIQEVSIKGDGQGKSIIKIASDPRLLDKQTRLITVNNVEKFEIHNLSLIGAADFNPHPDETPATGEVQYWKNQPNSLKKSQYFKREQQSLLFWRNSNAGFIKNVSFTKAGGDGINISNVRNVTIARSIFKKLGRNGLTIGGVRGKDRSQNVLVFKNFFGASIDTQQIDTELHGDTPYSNDTSQLNDNIQVIKNTFEPQLPQDEIDGDQFSMTFSDSNRGSFKANNVGDNPIGIYNAQNQLIANNTSIGNISISRESEVKITNNLINLKPMERKLTQPTWGIYVKEAVGLFPMGIELSFNRITSLFLKKPLFFQDTKQLYIKENSLLFDNEVEKNLVVHAEHTDIKSNKLNEDKLELIETNGYRVIQIDE